MNLSENRRMHPHLRDEEARVIENAVRLAVDSIINVLASVDCARTREHERVLAERDAEIRRLSSRETRYERELQALRRQVSGNRAPCTDHCPAFPDRPPNPESGDPWPDCDEGGEAAGRGRCEMSFSLGLLTTPPSQGSTPRHFLATPSPSTKPARQQARGSQSPEVKHIVLDVPVIKDEPPNMDASCESMDLHSNNMDLHSNNMDLRSNNMDLHTPVLLPGQPDLGSAPVQSAGDDDSSPGDSGEDEESPGEEYRPPSPGGEPPAVSTSHTWHYNFQIPWNKMSSYIQTRLQRGERPSKSERREVIRVIAGELLATCKTTSKAHVLEVARRVILTHPKSFQDEMAGEVVGSGYDSFVRQMMSHIYNVRRSEPPLIRKRAGRNSRDAASGKRRRRDAYGCLNPEPALPAGETSTTQRRKMEELQRMFRNQDSDAGKMEALMALTFASQRKDVVTLQKDTKELLKKWPYLFQEAGMRVHLRELTGVQIANSSEETTATKFQKVLEYFQCLPTDPLSREGDLVVQTQQGCDPTCGALLMLLAHFNEQHQKMFLQVAAAAGPLDVDTAALPWTPCVVVCGECPLTAKAFMVAVDQLVVSKRLPTFGEALHMMFYSYYIHNMDYPAEIWATMEFLQRCIFKINPDQSARVQKRGGVGRVLVNPKVLRLLSRMSEFERK